MAELTTARGSKRGQRLPPPAPLVARAVERDTNPGQPPARGRPATKVCGLSTDRDQRAKLSLLLTQLELELAEANSVDGAGTIEGQTLAAGLTARVWSVRSLMVTDINTRARCEQQADMARTQLVRLEKAQHAARAKRLVEVVERQQAGAKKFQGLKRAR